MVMHTGNGNPYVRNSRRKAGLPAKILGGIIVTLMAGVVISGCLVLLVWLWGLIL